MGYGTWGTKRCDDCGADSTRYLRVLIRRCCRADLCGSCHETRHRGLTSA